MKKLWENITSKDVERAIELFNNSKENYPKPRNTFLIYEGKKYPAKHIRGLAYFIANKKRIDKSEYNGGKETATFFTKLWFTVEYNKQNILPTEMSESNNPKTFVQETEKRTKRLDAVSQKNSLQLLLQKQIGFIETEKNFNWLKTPNRENIAQEYLPIIDALNKYRNHDKFLKYNRQLQ